LASVSHPISPDAGDQGEMGSRAPAGCSGAGHPGGPLAFRDPSGNPGGTVLPAGAFPGGGAPRESDPARLAGGGIRHALRRAHLRSGGAPHRRPVRAEVAIPLNRLAWLTLLAVAGLVSPGLARGAFHTPPRPPSTLARADSAWARGDRSTARRLYAAVFARQPGQSRVVFRLAQLANYREQALLFYHRYITLEPNDPWGYMAAGDVLSQLGRTREALEEYDRAARLAPAERDVAVGRARTLNRAGRREEAALMLESWLSDHPDDAAVRSDL